MKIKYNWIYVNYAHRLWNCGKSSLIAYQITSSSVWKFIHGKCSVEKRIYRKLCGGGIVNAENIYRRKKNEHEGGWRTRGEESEGHHRESTIAVKRTFGIGIWAKCIEASSSSPSRRASQGKKRRLSVLRGSLIPSHAFELFLPRSMFVQIEFLLANFS